MSQHTSNKKHIFTKATENLVEAANMDVDHVNADSSTCNQQKLHSDLEAIKNPFVTKLHTLTQQMTEVKNLLKAQQNQLQGFNNKSLAAGPYSFSYYNNNTDDRFLLIQIIRKLILGHGHDLPNDPSWRHQNDLNNQAKINACTGPFKYLGMLIGYQPRLEHNEEDDLYTIYYS